MKAYREYVFSPVPWIVKMPSHWDLVRGKNLFIKMQRPFNDSDEVVTCFRDGTVTLRKNRRTTGFTESLKEIGYQGIKKGDLVIHAMERARQCIVFVRLKATAIIITMPSYFVKWQGPDIFNPSIGE